MIGNSMSCRYSYLVFQGAVQVAKMKSGSLWSEMAELTRNSLCKSNMCGHDEIRAALAYLLGEIMEEPRLSMEWLPDNYLKLMIEHGVEIDMMNYPGGKIVKPKCAIVQHLHEVIDGWKRLRGGMMNIHAVRKWGQWKWQKLWGLTAMTVRYHCMLPVHHSQINNAHTSQLDNLQ